MDEPQLRRAILTTNTRQSRQTRPAQGTAAVFGRSVLGSCMTAKYMRPGECLCRWRSRDIDLGCGWPPGPVPRIRDSAIAGYQSKHQTQLPKELLRPRYPPGAKGK